MGFIPLVMLSNKADKAATEVATQPTITFQAEPKDGKKKYIMELNSAALLQLGYSIIMPTTLIFVVTNENGAVGICNETVEKVIVENSNGLLEKQLATFIRDASSKLNKSGTFASASLYKKLKEAYGVEAGEVTVNLLVTSDDAEAGFPYAYLAMKTAGDVDTEDFSMTTEEESIVVNMEEIN